MFNGWAWLITGTHGVAIFFVLSGYLITSRLFDDGDLKRFYLRRFFRLMPVAWTYLVCVALIGALLGLHIIGSDAIACLLFYRNIGPVHETAQNALTSHFWSLSTEEQFYLVWPFLLALSRRHAVPIVLVLLALTSFNSHLWPQTGLLLGCLLAFAVRQQSVAAWIRRHSVWLLPVSLLSMAIHVAYSHFLISFTESLTITALLACTSLKPDARLARPLEWNVLTQTGLYSYSLYVWQELFLITHTGLIGPMLLPIVAIASYKLIERPCIEFGGRMARRVGVLESSPVNSSTVV